MESSQFGFFHSVIWVSDSLQGLIAHLFLALRYILLLDVPQFIYLLTCWGTFWLLPVLGSCSEYLHAGLFVEIRFHIINLVARLYGKTTFTCVETIKIFMDFENFYMLRTWKNENRQTLESDKPWLTFLIHHTKQHRLANYFETSINT